MRAMTGTDFYRSGLFTPGTAVIQPALYIQALGDGLAREGVTIFENSAVLELQPGPDWVARTKGGRVRAGKVVLAVNGHAQSFGQFERQLMQVYTYGSMTRAMRADEVERLGGQPNWGVTPSDPMGSTIRRISGIGGDRIVVRNRFTYDPSMQVSEAQLARIVHDHRRAFEARFPMLSDVGFEHSWGGHLCLSRNSVPAFGEVEPGLIAACCQNGLGTTKGTLAGLLAAEMVLGETSDLLAHQLSRASPSRLPPAPFFTPAARMYLRHIERRAGAEL